MKGIVLAGGLGTRLGSLTKGVSKQLLPVYKQPMIHYPLSTLRWMGITDILIIVSSETQKYLFISYLGDGSQFNLNLSYTIQEKPNGLAEAFIIAEDFIGDDDVTLILGDNIFINAAPIPTTLNSIYTYKVKDPSAYGVVELEDGKLKRIVEKPKDYVSDLAVVGLYVFDNSVVSVAKQVTPSARGELEIVDVIRMMNDKSPVNVHALDGFWFDAGTHDDLLDCGNFVRSLSNRSSYVIGL